MSRGKGKKTNYSRSANDSSSRRGKVAEGKSLCYGRRGAYEREEKAELKKEGKLGERGKSNQSVAASHPLRRKRSKQRKSRTGQKSGVRTERGRLRCMLGRRQRLERQPGDTSPNRILAIRISLVAAEKLKKERHRGGSEQNRL